MRSYELQPTYKNIKAAFLSNTINRNKELYYFISILDSITGSYSIALDSQWGSGKTFFVKQAKLILDAVNGFTDNCYIDGKDAIIQKWNTFVDGKTIPRRPQVAIYYDAWENDNDNDPMLSLAYQIIQDLDID